MNIMQKQYDLGRSKGCEEKIIDKDIIKKLIFSYVLAHSNDIEREKPSLIFEKEFDNNFNKWYTFLGKHFENDFNNS